jgi:hypothetical protein
MRAGNTRMGTMCWKAEYISDRKYHRKGDPVMAGDTFVITHISTNQALACSPKFVTANQFGAEFEISCHT